MSKVKRFSLEERYGYQNRKVIYDKNANNDIELNNIYPIIDLLNQLDEQISDLQHRLDVAENALELCERHHIGFENPTIKEQVKWRETRIKENTNYFKAQAEKELKGEKL